MQKNRITFAKLQILRYVEDVFTCLSDLLYPEIEDLMNMPSHGLQREELIIILHEMFSDHLLVAKKSGRELFTPTLSEIESALNETNDFTYRSTNTHYGLTSGAMELFVDLQRLYSAEPIPVTNTP